MLKNKFKFSLSNMNNKLTADLTVIILLHKLKVT